MHAKLQAPPPHVSVTAFLEDTKVRAQTAGDLAVSQMSGLGPTQITATPTLSTMSADSFDPDEVTGVDLTTSPHFQS